MRGRLVIAHKVQQGTCWRPFEPSCDLSVIIPNAFFFFLATEIVFLRTTVPAYGSYRLGSYDVKFTILEGNVDNAFDVIKRVENGFYVGERYILYALALASAGRVH